MKTANASQFDSWDALSHYYAENDARNMAGFFEDRDGSWYHVEEELRNTTRFFNGYDDSWHHQRE
jgi:hypothetical protein